MRTLGLVALLTLGAVTTAGAALLDVLRDPRLGTASLDAALTAIGPALGDAVASTYPVPSASSSVYFAYDPVEDTFVRRTGMASPLVGERAETIGRGAWNLTASYADVDLDTINGQDLDDLVNKPYLGSRRIIRHGAFMLSDNRTSTFVPVLVRLGLGVQARIVNLALVYGVVPDLDLSVVLPVIHSEFRADVDITTPDPRAPRFDLCRTAQCSPTPAPPRHEHRSASDSATGIGDVVLRAKYVVTRAALVDVAAILALALPTGARGDFQGLGYARVEPMLVASRYFGWRVQAYADAGVDVDTSDVQRSVVRWLVGTSVRVADPLTASVAFLGRHDLARQSRVALPFFFQIRRNDVIDASVGLRLRLWENGSIGANALVPVNSDGLRADVIPMVALEWVL